MQGISKRFILVVALLCFGLLVISQAIPQRLNYQAVLKNKTTGRVLPDGNYTLTFRLYTASTGGSALWAETASATITNGVLTHPLGSVTTLNLAFDQNYYLGVQVSGDSEMSPRERLTSVGYAYRAANADNSISAVTATTLQGYIPGDFGDITQVHAGDGLRGGGSYGAVTVQVNAGGGLSTSNDTVVLSSGYQSGSAYDSRFLNATGGDTWQGALVGIDTLASTLLTIRNYGSGRGIYAYSSSGHGIEVQSDGEYGNAVRASNNSDSYSTVNAMQYGPWRAVTGYNQDTVGGIGVGGVSSGLNGVGVEGYANRGIGVYGYSTTTAAIVAENAGQGNALYAVNSSSSNTLEVINNGSGRGIYAESSTWTGIKGVSYGGAGVAGESYANYGTGAHGSSYGILGGYGVYAYCGGTSGNGVYASAPNGTGVYGYSNSTNNAIYGRNLGSGEGVYGYSSTGYGISGESYRGPGVYGRALYDQGVYGRTDGTGYNGVYGYATGSNSWGVRGDGVRGYGARFTSASTYALYVSGDAYFSGSKTGYVVDLCINGDSTPLELGDVVVIKGSNPAVIGDIPVIVVSKTASSYNSAVVGVVDKAQQIAEQEVQSAIADDPNGFKTEKEISVNINQVKSVEPNEYVNIVTLGAYKAVKVDASYGAIIPGDLLVTSPNAGYAMKADSNLTKVGTVIGKALGSLASGQGTIPVFVGHQ